MQRANPRLDASGIGNVEIDAYLRRLQAYSGRNVE